MHECDTIAAISTPYGTGGIGIVRISGSRAFEIAAALFKGKKEFKQLKSHTINFGKIVDPDSGYTVDEVLLSIMKGPSTFTKEDIVEINCHGGITVLKKVLELVVGKGARPAGPGEFTKRAFLNGRIDLSQAEAVIDLINSKTAEGSRAAVDQLEGKLSAKIKEVRNRLIELIAHIEVTVDYPEHDIEEITSQKVYEGLKTVEAMLDNIIKGYEKGRIIREGIGVVIVGKPNVGKSSLLNELCGKNRAIVTDIPGTTRDILEEYVNIGGIPVRVLDTAGIRKTEDIVEKIGVEKTEKEIESADLVIMMVDAVSGLTGEDKDVLDRLKCKKAIVLLNKIDLVDESSLGKIEKELKDVEYIKTSVKLGIGIDNLERKISELFLEGEVNINNEILLTNVRHKSLIDEAIKSIKEAYGAHEMALPLDMITIDIKNAAEHLGQITGETVSEDVMHEIFSRFCIGK